MQALGHSVSFVLLLFERHARAFPHAHFAVEIVLEVVADHTLDTEYEDGVRLETR